MSKLPQPKPLATPAPATPKPSKEIDLNALFGSMRQAYSQKSDQELQGKETEPTLTSLLYELIHPLLWRLPTGKAIIEHHIGYSTKYQSLAVALKEGDAVKAVCIRQATDKAGNIIKWKTYGSKRFIPHRIFDFDDPSIFIGFGIGEFLLFELLELNYIAIQSDAIAKNIAHGDFEPLFEEGYIFALLDNDKSCRATLRPLKEYFHPNPLYGIDFENVWDKELPKGYDFRDFCNNVVAELLTHTPNATPQQAKEAILLYLASEIKTILGGR